ncbi:hypothetical protein D3C78_1291360 [compost metagenome]
MVIGLFLRQRRVGHGCQQQRTGAGDFRIPGKRNGLIGAQSADTRHQYAPALKDGGGGLDGATSLFPREIHVDAGAAENADGIDRGRIQPLDQGREGFNIDPPRLVGRRNRKSRKSLESSRHVYAPHFDRKSGLQSRPRGRNKSGG